MGTDHIIRINTRASGAIVTAIVEPDAAQAAAALTHAPDAKQFANISDAIASGLIDAALVATPGAFHEEVLLPIIAAGLPVLCEKPFAVNAIEVQAMVAAARANNVALLEAMWTRFLPHISKVRELLASGVIGEIVNVEADHGQYLLDLAVGSLLIKARVSHSVGRSAKDAVWTSIESENITFFDKSGKAL